MAVNRFVLNGISYHGHGAINEIPGIIESKGFKKAFVASDPDLVKFGVTAKVTDLLEKNGIAYSGHVMADNYPDAVRNGYSSVVEVLRTMQIPGIDVIWEQIRWPYGGRQVVDEEETQRMPFFTRIATSAARQTGRNLALTETYSIYGDGISPDEMRYVSNYQAVRGINVFNFLTLPY